MAIDRVSEAWGGPAQRDSDAPVMLALSAFRQSGTAIDTALRKAESTGRLVVAYVVDVNLARYMVGMDSALFPDLKASCEADLLQEYRRKGEAIVARIAGIARERGIQTTTHLEVGRFAQACLEAAVKERPSVIVTTRSKRPDWVKRFFGSPVDLLIRDAPCPVEDV